MIAIQRIIAIAVKELRQLSRDRGTFAMVIMIPIIELLLFGYAINTDVRHLRAAYVDHSQTAFSRQLIAEAGATQIVDFVQQAATSNELEAMIRRGDIAVGFIIPHDAHRRNQQQGRAVAQIVVDGSDPVIAGVVAQLRQMPLGLRNEAGKQMQTGTFAIQILYNPEKRSAVNVVPGLVGFILTLTMVLFTAIAIVREKEQGTLELLIATPLSTMQLMIGKVIPYIGIGLIQAALILGFGYWVFSVPINGSLWDMFIACLVFIAASLTLGLVISTVAKTQLQAMQMTVFVFMPSILLSGFVFPFDGMPRVAQWLAEVLPLTHFLRIVRGLVLRGAELGELMNEVYFLIAFAVVTLIVAGMRFQKRLD